MSSERFIPLSTPVLGAREAELVQECLAGGWVSSAGPFVERFERAVAARTGAPHAVATASGTAALHVALLVAGVEPDDEVLVPALTFVAPANAVRYCGAWPVFVDVDPVTWQMDPARARELLERRCRVEGGALVNRASGRRVRALLPVDLLGHPADLDPLVALAQAHGLVVVEDASQAVGATYRGRPVGGLADVTCLSFNGNKVMTTGGGGMLLTARAEWAERARYLTTQARDDPVEYVHTTVGFNYRLTSLAAALGCAQLERLDALLGAKRRLHAAYVEALGGLPGVSFQAAAPWAGSTWWLTAVRLDPRAFGSDRRAVHAALRARGVESRPLWQALTRSPAHAGAEAVGGAVAEALQADGLCLPSSPDLRDEDLARVVAVVKGCARA